jgi:hypothetical protein
MQKWINYDTHYAVHCIITILVLLTVTFAIQSLKQDVKGSALHHCKSDKKLLKWLIFSKCWSWQLLTSSINKALLPLLYLAAHMRPVWMFLCVVASCPAATAYRSNGAPARAFGRSQRDDSGTRLLRTPRQLSNSTSGSGSAPQQGCTNMLLDASFPSLSSVPYATSWLLNQCGGWFTAADGRTDQPCYLQCETGTFADASTQYSLSAFWCQSSSNSTSVQVRHVDVATP